MEKYEPKLGDVIRPKAYKDGEYLVVQITEDQMGYFILHVPQALRDGYHIPGDRIHYVDLDIAENATTYIRKATRGEMTLYGS